MNTNTLTIADFKAQHGLRAIVRRHAVYNKPALPVDSNMMCALIYSRTIDPQLLGLNAEGAEQMYHQGELLAKMGIVPNRIVTGIDLRNWEGGLQTAAAIKKVTETTVPCHRSPAVTYPYYDATKVVAAWEKFGDFAAHAYLAGCPKVEGLWTESPEAFQARIVAGVDSYGSDWPLLFDLNFEQLTLLHFLHVEKIRRQDIPYDSSAWIPKNGGGIAYGTDGVVAEFHPDFTLV